MNFIFCSHYIFFPLYFAILESVISDHIYSYYHNKIFLKKLRPLLYLYRLNFYSMFTLYKKELVSFFGNITGYIVLILFLLANSIFMWIIPGELNVLDGGYANIDTLFIIAPFVFMFLVPAVSMRLFSEEKKTGTIELLFTRPLSDLEIIMAKYFAGFTIVIFSLLPTLVYYFSVYQLGATHGNLDSGGIWGSYIGLMFLAAIYMSIGVFASSLSDNQVISFLVSLLFIFIFYLGFDYLSQILYFDNLQAFTVNLGIDAHYKSLSRGVIDTRDVLYFLGVISAFVLFTKIVLQSRKW